jgi:outer membrane protein OmpA-like peptidoglycan-associated protein
MIDRRWAASLVAALGATVLSSCGPQRVQTAERPGQTVVVLLPDAGGTVGRASVSNSSGTANLSGERDSTTVTANQPPGAVTQMSEAEVRRLFDAALSALPPAPQRFTLFYRFGTDELTDESRALLPEILQAVKNRPVPDVVVIGHTDTTGTTASNFELGLKRATSVRNQLVEAGLDASVVEVISLGEEDLLIATADEVAEPRNRRVDIAVR